MVNAQVAQDTPVLDKLYEVVSTLLLPCLALLPGQVPLSHEVWDILRGLSAETRYRIYTDYRVNGSSSWSPPCWLHPAHWPLSDRHSCCMLQPYLVCLPCPMCRF